MSLELPANPNLEHLKKQAKELLSQSQQDQAAALERFRSFVSFSTPANLKLADAQHVIAREYGFSTWPKLKEHVESVVRSLEPAGALSAAVCQTAVWSHGEWGSSGAVQISVGGACVAGLMRARAVAAF